MEKVRYILASRLNDENTYFVGSTAVCSDVNCDGVIDVYDVYTIMQMYVRTVAGLPVYTEGKYYYEFTAEDEQNFLDDYNYIHPDAPIETLSEYFSATQDVIDYLDFDEDGRFDLQDISVLMDIYVNRVAGTGIYGNSIYEYTDLNLDGEVDLDDVQIAINIYAEKVAGLL